MTRRPRRARRWSTTWRSQRQKVSIAASSRRAALPLVQAPTGPSRPPPDATRRPFARSSPAPGACVITQNVAVARLNHVLSAHDSIDTIMLLGKDGGERFCYVHRG
ncbi:unnamed protein product [Vitrella brassicaformis CCMP3155]|uniref:Uncharacterized protein n=1 Tax=Vitrella brassicaformis (strain CCMP3155) TaxID=1169540 RepID=A0A0G4EE96_VITBC|nr:unnamed protein product [Vitrella brassicaformis CCMP3155]|eukprot:CEL94302.1 unnamed protein product [Vitrella brassicaformis CCMP3155]